MLNGRAPADHVSSVDIKRVATSWEWGPGGSWLRVFHSHSSAEYRMSSQRMCHNCEKNLCDGESPTPSGCYRLHEHRETCYWGGQTKNKIRSGQNISYFVHTSGRRCPLCSVWSPSFCKLSTICVSLYALHVALHTFYSPFSNHPSPSHFYTAGSPGTYDVPSGQLKGLITIPVPALCYLSCLATVLNMKPSNWVSSVFTNLKQPSHFFVVARRNIKALLSLSNCQTSCPTSRPSCPSCICIGLTLSVCRPTANRVYSIHYQRTQVERPSQA